MAPPTRNDTVPTPTAEARTRGEDLGGRREDGRRSREPAGVLVLGRYRLHKPLGAGGFGSVWLAYDERLERDVAIKMLPRARVIGGRFEREARAAARLNHPGIVTLYEAAVDDHAAYLVSELVRGPTLGELLEAGRLSDRDIVEIGIAVCNALEHAHAHGVVHRDVKPTNILVPEHPSSAAALAKLTDFGVARVIGGNTLTRTGEVVGTAAYMAPEQAEGREADAAADLYSLALVLYEALTGVNPFAAARPGRARRLGTHLPPLRRYRRELPAELGRAIDLALRPRASERGRLQELRAGLVATLDDVRDDPGQVALDPSPSPPAPPPAELPATNRQPPSWAERALAGACTAGLVAWLGATAFSSPPLPPPLAALIAGVAVAALPRLSWVALTLCSAAALAIDGRAGTALLVSIAILLPVVLLPRSPTRWPLIAAAPALGAVMLAGAWPALAAWDRGPYRRAALAALGWASLSLAGLLAGHGLYAKLPPGTHIRAQWTGSPNHAVAHALWPLAHSAALAPALIWAVAAALLPWIARGSLPVRVVLITVWSAGLATATTSALHATAGPSSGAVVLGALAGGIAALIPSLLGAHKRLSAYAVRAAGLA